MLTQSGRQWPQVLARERELTADRAETGLTCPAVQDGRKEHLSLPGVAHVGVLAGVEPRRAPAHRLGLAQPHLTLEYTAGLGVQRVHLQLVLVLEVAVPLAGGHISDGLVRNGVDSTHGYQVLVSGSQHKTLAGKYFKPTLRGTLHDH